MVFSWQNVFLCDFVLYSGPHLDSSGMCWPWIQILLPGEQIWLVCNNYVHAVVPKTLSKCYVACILTASVSNWNLIPSNQQILWGACPQTPHIG